MLVTYSSARERRRKGNGGETLQEKALVPLKLHVAHFWKKREHFPAGKHSLGTSRLIMWHSYTRMIILLLREVGLSLAPCRFAHLEQAMRNTHLGCGGQKLSAVSAWFRTKDLLRVRQAWWPLHYGNRLTHALFLISEIHVQSLLMCVM